MAPKQLTVKKNRHAPTTDDVEVVREALRQRSGSWPELVRGSPLPYRWTLAFASNQIKDPSYRRLKILAGLLGINVKLEQKDVR